MDELEKAQWELRQKQYDLDRMEKEYERTSSSLRYNLLVVFLTASSCCLCSGGVSHWSLSLGNVIMWLLYLAGAAILSFLTVSGSGFVETFCKNKRLGRILYAIFCFALPIVFACLMDRAPEV